MSHWLFLPFFFPTALCPQRFINIPPRFITSQHICAAYHILNIQVSRELYYTFVFLEPSSTFDTLADSQLKVVE